MRGLLLSLMAFASPAMGDTFCQQLLSVFDASRTMSLPYTAETQVTCSTSLALSGETSVNCAWPFAYRAPDAARAFEALVASVASCLEVDRSVLDQDVNHPDFYDLRIFNAPIGEVGVSLKDKGGLQETYVFLRATPAK